MSCSVRKNWRDGGRGAGTPGVSCTKESARIDFQPEKGSLSPFEQVNYKRTTGRINNFSPDFPFFEPDAGPFACGVEGRPRRQNPRHRPIRQTLQLSLPYPFHMAFTSFAGFLVSAVH